MEIEKKENWIEEMIQREATPKPERTETIEKFCEKHDIAPGTYNYQKNKKENKKKVIEIWLNEAIEGGNEVLAKLKENAVQGKEKSIEMYLKFILELSENLDIKSNGQPLQIHLINYAHNSTPISASLLSAPNSPIASPLQGDSSTPSLGQIKNGVERTNPQSGSQERTIPVSPANL